MILARFVPIVRTFTATVAGVARMPHRTFVLVNAIGAVLWGCGLSTAGYALGGVGFVADHVELMTLTVVGLSLVPAAVSVLRRRFHGSAKDDAPARDLAEAS